MGGHRAVPERGRRPRLLPMSDVADKNPLISLDVVNRRKWTALDSFGACDIGVYPALHRAFLSGSWGISKWKREKGCTGWWVPHRHSVTRRIVRNYSLVLAISLRALY